MPQNAIKLDPAQVEEERNILASAEYKEMQEKVDKEEESFEKAFDEATSSKESTKEGISYKVDSMARKVRSIFDQRVRDRYLLERKWLRQLRQYRGEYSEETLQNLHPNRSKAFVRFTRTKVKTVTSRLVDFLFPANGEKNWGIEPTPIPVSNPEMVKLMQLQFEEQTGQPISSEDLIYQVFQQAKAASENMSKEIEDQLNDCRYRDILKSVIHSGCLYGTGILKGPQITLKDSKAYVQDMNGQWVTIESKQLVPFLEHVSLWDFYPDLTSKTIDNCRDIIQRHYIDKSKLVALANRGDFRRDAINQYLEFNQHGHYEKKAFETQLDVMGDVQNANTNPSQNDSKKYEMLEYWGFVDAYDLERLGVTIPEEMKGIQELRTNIFVLGDRIIKAVIDPLGSDNWPYYAFYFDKDETSIFGEGIAEIMSDIQELLNASFRGMLDNAAVSAGPQVEVNLDLLGPDEDPTDIYPFKTWLRTGTGIEAQEPAIRVHKLPSYTNEFIAMSQFIEQYGDEVTTIPKFLHGGPTAGGAGRTMGGMSMMQGNANITIKDQVKNFDDGITKPFITAIYHWNMQFNDKPEIKGDFDVVATGTSSLIAKEVYTDSLIQFANITANPLDQAYVKRQYLISEICKSLDLDVRQAMKTEIEMAAEQRQAQQQQQEQQAFAMNVTETARQGGISPDDLLNYINMLMEEMKRTQAMIAQSQAGPVV